MTHVRGLHETSGLQSLRILRSKEEAGKLTTKLARLDHQRSLLERQLAVWMEKQQITRQRLSVVEKQMDEIVRLVREFGMPRRRTRRRKSVFPGAALESQQLAGATPQHKEVKLEY